MAERTNSKAVSFAGGDNSSIEITGRDTGIDGPAGGARGNTNFMITLEGTVTTLTSWQGQEFPTRGAPP